MKRICYFYLLSFLLSLASCKEGNKVHGDLEESSKVYEFTNELINETSPYLLQHAHNPVNWKPWTNSVFEDAKKENRLIVLSIGYSTCHWCHVMEEESFEDEEVAQLMNDKFINIKVDREERPDVDMVYQTALQLVNGAGGWPMNAILLSDGSPVYLGTYHDKDEWISVLTKFREEFERNPGKMKEYASMLASGVQEVYEQPSKQSQAKVTQEKVVNGIRNWSNSWDLEWGGDRGQQKFIIPTNLSMLLDYSFLQKDKNASAYVFKTLEKVSQGGIYDHVGGGFFRYSTDSTWKVPHFEKMLYDNAQMLSLLSKAYKLSGNEEYERLTKQIFQFLKTEMRDEKGGYFSAMDADTNGEEGLYYLWTKDELSTLLGDEFDIFGRYFAINEDEVLENGKYVLSASNSVADFSKKESISQNEMNEKLKKWKSLLYEYRKTRETPSKDYKVITSWNSLLIDGLIEAYKTFGDATYLEEAKTTFEFLASKNYKNKELVHSYTANSKQKEVFLEDYAFFAKSAFGLYSVTLELRYLDLAKELMETAIKKYSTPSGFYYYNVSNEMIPKIINTNDGVLPSANAIMAQNLFVLGHLEYNKNYLKDAEILGSLIVEDFERQASSYGAWGSLLLHQAYPYYEIAIVGQKAKGLITKMNTHYLGNTLLVASSIPSDISLFKDRFLKEDTYIYVCQNSTCKLPVTTIEEAFEQLYSFGYENLGLKKFELSF